jgi:hypothetical protein
MITTLCQLMFHYFNIVGKLGIIITSVLISSTSLTKIFNITFKCLNISEGVFESHSLPLQRNYIKQHSDMPLHISC